MASTAKVIPFPSRTQDRPTERDIPDDRLDCSEAKSDDTVWQDFLAYHEGVLR
jgi:hypothetical protein